MWKWGTSWKAASPSITSRLAPAAPRVCRARAAICRATLKARIAAVSSTSCMSTAWARGTTSMWPYVIGWMSMKATTLSSWWVKLAGASPLTIAQKMQSSLNLIECPAPEVRRRFAASTAGAKERVARGGAHLQMRDDEAPGPSTQASAPQAPGRLGREDATELRCWTLQKLKGALLDW